MYIKQSMKRKRDTTTNVKHAESIENFGTTIAMLQGYDLGSFQENLNKIFSFGTAMLITSKYF